MYQTIPNSLLLNELEKIDLGYITLFIVKQKEDKYV